MAKKEEEVNKAVGAEEAPKAKYEVVQEFRDIVDFSKVHQVGDDVSNLEGKRLTELVESGLVAKK